MYPKQPESCCRAGKNFSFCFHLIGFLLLLCLMRSASAMEVVEIQPGFTQSPVGWAAGYYLDQTQALELDDVRQLAEDAWMEPEGESPSFGFSLDHLWVKLALRNQAPSAQHLLLEIAYPPLDHIEVQLVRDGELAERFQLGDTLPFSQRPINHRNFVVPVPMASGESVTLYLKIKTEGTLQAPITLWEHQTFHSEQQYALITQGLYFGIMLVMILYNLFLYFTVRHPSYLYYTGSVLGMSCITAALQGIGFQFIWPGTPAFNAVAIPVSISAFNAMGCVFAISLLDIKTRAPRVHAFLAVSAYFYALMLVPAFLLPYHISVLVIGLIGAVCSFFVFFMGFYLWSIGVRVARFYALAWSMLLGAFFLTAISKLGVIGSSFWLEHSVQIGSAAEVVLLSFALADRINTERQEKLVAQQAALSAQTSLANELDRMVSERTDALEQANRRLEELSIQDGLTGLFNRRHFDNLFRTEYRRAFREQDWISVLMIDVDHFKQINDSYGHPFGDQCLKQVAETLQQMTRRPPDIVARYGGEEFIVILPATDANGAAYVAERIRAAIAALRVRHDGQEAGVTVSIGVVSAIPAAGDHHEAVLKIADDNLYAAKHAGRDRITASQA